MSVQYDQPTRAPLAPNQSTRKAILLALIATGIGFLLICVSYWDDTHWLHETFEWIGIGLIVLCILGRTWCALYIGGRKNNALVRNGPYSVSRNPLYFFSIIGAVGVGAQAGSLSIASICGVIAWAVFLWMIMLEETALLANFGADYRDYCARVPRFLPKPSLWHDEATIEVRPRIVLTTFIDALVFLAAVPIAEGIEYLHDIGMLPVLLILP